MELFPLRLRGTSDGAAACGEGSGLISLAAGLPICWVSHLNISVGVPLQLPCHSSMLKGLDLRVIHACMNPETQVAPSCFAMQPDGGVIDARTMHRALKALSARAGALAKDHLVLRGACVCCCYLSTPKGWRSLLAV
eukprot:1159130-Pelagomonas_calceolata.AAC.14